MSKKTITGRQMQSIIMMFILGTTLLLGVNNQSKQDSWISIILAVLMVAPMLFVYATILRLYPGKNLFDIIVEIFGKITGKIICFLYVLYSLHLGSLIFRNNSEFIHNINMSLTPQIVSLFFLTLLCIATVSIGITNLGGVAKFTLPIVEGFIVFTSLLGLNKMNFNNILPIMNTDFKTLIDSSFSISAFPFGETVLCMALFASVEQKSNPRKIYFKALIISTVFLLIANLRNLFVLGSPTISLFYFPSYSATSVVSLGGFVNRVEVLISTNLLLASFVKASVCLFASSIGLAKIFGIKNYKTMVAPCGLIMVTYSVILYTNTTEMFDWRKVYPIYAFPFQVILPIIILIGAIMQTRKKSSKPRNSKTIVTNQKTDSAQTES